MAPELTDVSNRTHPMTLYATHHVFDVTHVTVSRRTYEYADRASIHVVEVTVSTLDGGTVSFTLSHDTPPTLEVPVA